MINETIAALLNEQINAELYSAYLYWDMAKHFDCNNLKGFAHWYKIQAKEEIDHARKIYNYMQDNGGNITLTTIAGPNEEMTDNISAAKLGLKHEKGKR